MQSNSRGIELAINPGAPTPERDIHPYATFQAGFGDDLVQPDPGGFGVLCVRYGQTPGCLILAGLARNRTTPASARNNFWRNKASLSPQPSQNHHGWYILL